MRQLDEVFSDRHHARGCLRRVVRWFIALRYAATRPERVSALILVSAPRPDGRRRRARALPSRAVALLRLSSLIAAPACGPRSASRTAGLAIAAGSRPVTAPRSSPRPCRRPGWRAVCSCISGRISARTGKVRAPTFVITGERRPRSGRPPVTRWYLDLHPRRETRSSSGRDTSACSRSRSAFAEIVGGFVHANSH